MSDPSCGAAHRDLRPDPYSLPSLRIVVLAYGGEPISSATGFIVEAEGTPFLITNWHVVTGRHNDTGKVLHPRGATPHSLHVWHHSALSIIGHSVWTLREEPLFDEDLSPLWIEHPRRVRAHPERPHARSIDMVALRLSDMEEVSHFPLNRDARPAVEVAPGLPVCIIGYPFGTTGTAWFPVWKTGHIASDLQYDETEEEFLIDVTAREGMSGSPVVYRNWRTNDAGVAVPETSFLGVYSGRTRADSELGIGWRASVVAELLAEALNRIRR